MRSVLQIPRLVASCCKVFFAPHQPLLLETFLILSSSEALLIFTNVYLDVSQRYSLFPCSHVLSTYPPTKQPWATRMLIHHIPDFASFLVWHVLDEYQQICLHERIQDARRTVANSLTILNES